MAHGFLIAYMEPCTHQYQLSMRFPHSYICAVILLVAGCSNGEIAAKYPQIPSYAISQNEKTPLGSVVRRCATRHKGESGFHVMPTGSESFAMRLALIRASTKTLDLQYYSINDDTTSNLLLEALVQAAQRGVRVRFLLDNIDFDAVAPTFAALAGMKNVEVRIFNPFSTRDEGLFSRLARHTINIEEMDHRMHNKAMIADNQMAITGGRNLGDEYFEQHSDITFRDLDMLSAGPIVADISKSFDRYWNDPNSLPFGRLKKPERYTAKAEEIKDALKRHWDTIAQTEKGRKLLNPNLAQRLETDGPKLIWAKAEFVADSPRKIERPIDMDGRHSHPMTHLEKLLADAHHEFIIVSPYFVPRESGVEWLAGLVNCGMTVKVLTNSLASTDMVAVHADYRQYRKALVDSGVELYELKPFDHYRPPQRLLGRTTPAYAMLHAKVYVIDRRDVMVGSFNFDPRSIGINTELAMIIHSPAVADEVMKMFNDAINPRSAYHIVEAEDGSGLVWVAQGRHGEVTFERDPHAGFWRSIEADMMSLLPIEDEL